ncbi:MAG: MarR family transcriptional regulator [Bacteroidota bacterium]
MTDKNKTSMDMVVDNLLSIHPLLAKNITKAIKHKTNHTPGSLFVLGTLSRHGKLSMTEIGCHLSLPKPHVTSLVEKLITDELVERLHDTNDRRIIYIQITEKGIKEFKELKLEIGQDLRAKLQVLDAEQINSLSEASQLLRDVLIKIFQIQPTGSCNTSEKI